MNYVIQNPTALEEKAIRPLGLLAVSLICCVSVMYFAALLCLIIAAAIFLALRAVWLRGLCSLSSQHGPQSVACHACQSVLGKMTKVGGAMHRDRYLCSRCLPKITEFRAIIALTLLLSCFSVDAAKPESLTYKIGGRRYVILTPNSQLWSVVEFARVAKADGDKLFIDGKEVRRARVRGDSYDKFGRNYLVIVMRTGKRLNPPPPVVFPIPPAAPSKSMFKSSKTMPPPPATITLGWDDVPGAVPGGWGSGPTIMPDGGTKFWVVYASRDNVAWKPVATTETNRVTIGTVWPHEFYRVHWRGQGEPAWRWP